MGVKILRKEKGLEGECDNCYFDENKDGESCFKHDRGFLSAILRCHTMHVFPEITPSEFNASTGKKWRVKKDGRVLPYDDDSAEVIIIMDDKK